MATMYETIMDLPLFKGVGKDHVSQFLEKTDIRFQNYKAGDTIMLPGEIISDIRYVISGDVRCSAVNHIDGLRISCRIGRGTVIGADRLFGIHTGIRQTLRAIGDVSVMMFSKEKYINLLNSDPIYQLNFFNFLSLRAQRPVEALLGFNGNTLAGRLALLVSVMCDADVSDIVIGIPVSSFAEYCAAGEDSELRYLERKKIITMEGSDIRIEDRRRLAEEGLKPSAR